MDLGDILRSVESGAMSARDAEKLASIYAIDEIKEYAKIDINRGMRRGGVPEIIFAESKRKHEIKEIMRRMLQGSGAVIVSRIKDEDYDDVVSHAKKLGAAVRSGRNSSTISASRKPVPAGRGTVGILAAGTSDVGVAEEARIVCEATGCRCVTGYDVGVAGLQRVFPILKEMVSEDAGCIIVVAGMEGALATVVSSMVSVPVIGVSTSVGYGYGQRGVAALASMLQSCSLGMAVVNIDGGVAAGVIASSIARGRDPPGDGAQQPSPPPETETGSNKGGAEHAQEPHADRMDPPPDSRPGAPS